MNIPQHSAQPQSVWDIYWSFSCLALQGFGGVLAVVQRVLVTEKHWLSEQEFIEEWAVAQVLPGPNVINLSLMIGRRYFGWRGALSALAGMLSLPLVIVLLLALLYSQFASLPLVAAALRGMAAVAAGLIIGTGLQMLPNLRRHPLGLPVAAVFALLTWLAVAIMRWPLFWVFLVLGSMVCVWSYRGLRQAVVDGSAPDA